MADELILEPGWSNAKVKAGLQEMQSEVKRAFVGIPGAVETVSGGFNKTTSGLTALEKQFGNTGNAANAFTRSLDRMSTGLTSGLGIGIALGGLALLEKGFERAIEKAKAFQTAQLSIAAAMTSAFKYQTQGGGQLTPGESYLRNFGESAKIVDEIIKRQAHNILTFQEELRSYQVSINPGARKGLDTKEILDVSERLAIVGKSLGLSGEKLSNNVRIMMGGGVNVARSVLGASLGVSNEDIKSKTGADYLKFIEEKTKGFGGTSTQNFKESIEGVLSTTQSAIDVFAAKVGQKFFDKTKPIIQELGKSLQGLDADKVADTMSTLFSAIAKGLEAIAKSPLIPEITKFLDFLAGSADKIIIGAVILKIASAMNSARGAAVGFANMLKGTGVAAAEAAAANDRLAASVERVVAAESIGSHGRLGVAPIGPSSSLASRDVARSIIGGQYGGEPPTEAIERAIQRQGRSPRLGGLVAGVEANRARMDASFANFTGTQAVMPPSITSEQIAQQNRLMEQERLANRGRNIDRGIRGLAFAGITYGLTDVARDMTGTNGPGNAGVAGAQAAATVTAGLLGAGMGLTPMTAAIALFAGGVTAVTTALKEAADDAKASEEKLQAFRKAHPLAAKVEDDREKLAELEKQAKAGMPTGEITQHGGGLLGALNLGPQASFEMLRRPETRKELAANKKDQEDLQADIRRSYQIIQAKQTAANEAAGADEYVKQAQARLTTLGFGYGIENDRAKIGAESHLREAQIYEGAEKGTLISSPEEMAAAKAKADQIQAGLARKAAFAKNFPGTPIGYTGEEQKYVDLSSLGPNGEGTPSIDQKKIAQDLTTKRYLKESAARTEAQKSLFGAEETLKGLSTVKAGENTITEAENLFKVANAKLDDLSKNFAVPAEQIANMRLQAKANLDVAKLEKAYQDSHGSIGDNDYSATVGKAVSGLLVKTLGRYGDVYGAQGDTVNEALARKEAEIEGKRGTVDDFDRFRSSSLSTFEKQNAMRDLSGGGLSVDEQVAKSMRDAQERLNDNGLAVQNENQNFARRTQDRRLERQENPLREQEAAHNIESAQLNAQRAAIAPVLDTGQGPYSGVASAIKYSVDAQQGFDPQAYEQAYRESIEIKKKEAVLAQENANLQVQEAAIARQRLALGLERSDEDYQKAVTEHNIALRKLAENAQALSEGMARAQEDLAKAAAYMAGGTNSIKTGAISEINSLASQAGVHNITISPTINTTVNVAPETSLDASARAQLKREIADSIEQDLDRACKRS